MANNLLKFKKELEANIKHRNAPGETESFSFHMCSEWHYPMSYMTGSQYSNIIDLDEEDINYFKNKYLPKISSEMEDKIRKIKDEYNETIIK